MIKRILKYWLIMVGALSALFGFAIFMVFLSKKFGDFATLTVFFSVVITLSAVFLAHEEVE